MRNSYPASYRRAKVGFRARRAYSDPYDEVRGRLDAETRPPINEVDPGITRQRDIDRNASLDAFYKRHRIKQMKKTALQELEEKQLREAIDAARAAGNRRMALALATKLARKLNLLSTVVDILNGIDGMFGQDTEPTAERAQVAWPGKAGWTLDLSCAPASGILSPYSYPQLRGSSCLTLWSNLVTERGFYQLQTISGSVYRIFRLMEQAQLNFDVPPIDRGRTFEQYMMLESTFATNSEFYRRNVGSAAASRHHGVRGALAYGQQLNPQLLPLLEPVPTPRPLPYPHQPHRPRPGTDEASGGSNGQPLPGTGTGAGAQPGPQPNPGGGAAPGGTTQPPGTAIAFDGTGRAHRYRTIPHQRRPAGKNEKEAKVWGRAARLLNHVLNGVTEYGDYVDAAKQALAANGIRVRGYDPVEVLDALWNNWTPELAGDFFVALTINEIGDRVFGRMMAKRAKAAGRNPFDGSVRLHGEGIRGGPANQAAYSLGRMG